MNEERPPRLWWAMWKRFLIGGVLVVALSFAATLTVALNTATSIAEKVFRNTIVVPKGLVTPVYSGGPQTFLVLGSDRRAKAKSAYDRSNPPHSDTILLVRLDPEQGQTSVLSIPRDLMVNISGPHGQYYPSEKINAAYTIGSKLGGAKGGMVLAAETIEHEVFPGLKLNGIIDVNFAGFINVVDSLGCVYVNVDHRYYHVNGIGAENYSEINLQPGYQKLCYQNALSYVRYRHGDSDFVRVARQQDFLRDLREQISPSDVIGQLEPVAKAVGRAIVSTFKRSHEELFTLAKLIAFSQGKPLRQVKFRALNVNAQLRGGSFVTTTPALAQATLRDFQFGRQKVSLPHAAIVRVKRSSHSRGGSRHATPSAAAIGLYPTPSSGQNALVSASVHLPFRALYPALQTGPATQQQARAYALRDEHNHLHRAYIVPWQQNTLGGYYDFEGTDWKNPPLIAHPDEQRKIGGRTYMIFSDGSHIHVIAWRSGGALYWLTNTLLEDLSNAQMLAIARSARPLH
ncbi:MAG: LytR family transcriptional regulator [Actinobacteria bacterium]|nr:MAG: LytR family transcriptional regulator [Actinomycetota bacterium]